MKRSLSVLFPIRSIERSMDLAVSELLEVLPDLTPRFEALLIDDGSMDYWSEAAHDLARSYPQVQVLRQAPHRGRQAAVRGGLAESTGEIVLVRDEGCLADVQELRKLWRLIDDYAAVIGRAAVRARSTSVGGDWQMYHRQVAERLCRDAADGENLTAELTRDGYRWCEVELRSRAGLQKPAMRSRPRGVQHRADAPPAGPAAVSRPKRPRFLDRIRTFAWGE